MEYKGINIELSRDSLLTDFGKKTLEDRYLLPEEDSPQKAFARAAIAFSDDLEMAQRIYDYASQLWFMYSTPILSNGGTDRGLPISCFLNLIEDSREGISSHYDENIWLSSNGGGIGGCLSDLRTDGTSTSSGSASNGMIPFLKVVDSLMLACSQGRTRRGSYAAYLDISHPEIELFVDMRKPTGGDINLKCLNLHHGVNLTDAFMEAVEQGSSWDLIDPHTKEVVSTVDARELWQKLLITRMETGEPYFHFIDESNRRLPECQKEKGLEIRQSNLCVAPETQVLTKNGYRTIKYFKDQECTVWNGQEWSQVIIRKTSERSSLVTIKFSDGSELECTPQHKFYVQNNYNKSSVRVVEASELIIGDKLEKWELPSDVEFGRPYDYDMDPGIHNEAYSQGFYSGDGNTGLAYSWLYEEKYMCASNLIGTLGEEHLSSKRKTWKHGIMHRGKDYVPRTEQTLTYCLGWLAGLLDADGTVVRSTNGDCVQLASINESFLIKVKSLLEELGVFSRVKLVREAGAYEMPNGKGGLSEYTCKEIHRLIISTAGTKRLLDLGLDCLRLQFQSTQDPNRDARHFITVTSINYKGREDSTYCATESKRSRLCFNGIVTGNCSEIILPTSEQRTAVCCLSSVNVEKYDDWKNHPTFIADLVRFLDNVLEGFISRATEKGKGLQRAVYSAMQERSIGLGAMGFHAFLQSKNVAFESAVAKSYNNQIFENIRRNAEAASVKLGEERGYAPDCVGSGTFQKRNVHLLAVAPNASSSIICGTTSPSIEPYSSNAYVQKTLSGSFKVINPHLKKVLQEKGQDTEEVWSSILTNGGSVQELDFLSEHEKDVFKTAFELDQLWVIEHAADRQKYIDQSQSVNLFFPSGSHVEYLHKVHWEAWKKKMKTLYYLRSGAVRKAEKVGQYTAKVNNDECFSCQG